MSSHILQEDSDIFVALIGKLYFVLVGVNVFLTACETLLDSIEEKHSSDKFTISFFAPSTY